MDPKIYAFMCCRMFMKAAAAHCECFLLVEPPFNSQKLFHKIEHLSPSLYGKVSLEPKAKKREGTKLLRRLLMCEL